MLLVAGPSQPSFESLPPLLHPTKFGIHEDPRMSAASESSSSIPLHPLISYLYKLQRCKIGLPCKQLTCVSASPQVTTADSLLQLASSVGPYIAIFQVHADAIDDWSAQTARDLVGLARRHNFLLWEGGRLLNENPGFLEKSGRQSREEMKENAATARRRYIKGDVSVASWAGLATSWPSGIGARDQETDILIPMLKLAARGTVAEIAQVIKTEITVGKTPHDSHADNNDEDENEGNGLARSYLSPNSATISSGPELSPRRGSAISLTRTISQRTEPSSPPCSTDIPSIPEESFAEDRFTIYAEGTDALSPPLLARGLVLCLPSDRNSSPPRLHRQSCVAAARANRDFVVGFVCHEQWPAVSLRDDLRIGDSRQPENNGNEPNGDVPNEQERDSFVVFSSLSEELNRIQTADDDEPGIETSSTSRPAQLLHAAVARGLRKISADAEQREGRSRQPCTLHIPVVTLGV